MLTRIDFFPDSVLNAREEILEPRFTAEEIEERAERRRLARADAKARAEAEAAAAAIKRTPEAIAERAERRAAYKREGEERKKMGDEAWKAKESLARRQRLMLGMALHPRLGKDSPLAVMEQFVHILAKQI